jgi:hypothetical protein
MNNPFHLIGFKQMVLSALMASFSLMAVPFFYVNAPVVDMREMPSHDAEIVSQAIFAEEVFVEKSVGAWVYIYTPDGYSGWVLSDGLTERTSLYKGDVIVTRLLAHLYGAEDTTRGPIKSLPYGVPLTVLDAASARWLKVALPDGAEGYIQKGNVAAYSPVLSKEELIEWSRQFLGLPYTWGGRSSFGYDCSGFVQICYRQLGISLQRDARQQINDPRFKAISIDKLEAGDLVFFGKSPEKITHVGLYVGNNQFIHAVTALAAELKPWLRISNLSDLTWSGHPESCVPYRAFRQLITHVTE